MNQADKDALLSMWRDANSTLAAAQAQFQSNVSNALSGLTVDTDLQPQIDALKADNAAMSAKLDQLKQLVQNLVVLLA